MRSCNLGPSVGWIFLVLGFALTGGACASEFRDSRVSIQSVRGIHRGLCDSSCRVTNAALIERLVRMDLSSPAYLCKCLPESREQILSRYRKPDVSNWNVREIMFTTPVRLRFVPAPRQAHLQPEVVDMFAAAYRGFPSSTLLMLGVRDEKGKLTFTALELHSDPLDISKGECATT